MTPAGLRKWKREAGGGGGVTGREGEVTTEAEAGLMWGHQTRNAGSFQKARREPLPRASGKDAALPSCTSAPGSQFQSPDLRGVSVLWCCVKPRIRVTVPEPQETQTPPALCSPKPVVCLSPTPSA